MGKSRTQEYSERFSDQIIRFNPYTFRKIGLVRSQVFLKIEDYLLICSPFELSMKRGIFLVVLSSQEISFFQRFQKKICSLNLSFQKTGNKKPMSFFLRGNLDRIGPIKGKQNVCMMDLSFKICPNELIDIIGNYILAYESLKSQYESFKNKDVAIDSESSKIMRFNDYVELQCGSQKTRVDLLSLSVNKLVCSVPAATAGLEEGARVKLKLYFQIYQFLVNGTVVKLEKPSGGRVLASFEMEFSAELVEILDDYFFRQSLKTRS